MAFHRLNLAQWNIFIVIIIFLFIIFVICGCLFWVAEMPICGAHLPCTVSSFLWVDRRKLIGADVGGQDAAGQCVCLRSQFTLIILV